MLTVVKTPVFQRQVKDVMGESELAGDVVPGTCDLRKVRWSREGMGKRGDARVINFNRLASGEVVIAANYAKAKFDNLPLVVLKMWKEAYDG